MITITPLKFDSETLLQYQALFNECFPKATKFNIEYLTWLYIKNPAGNAVGFDARDDHNVVVAHYACIPVKIVLNGSIVNALLSLNTATSAKYQGKGLFTKLAAATYEYAGKQGFSCVYGIANANSTHGFIKKLGFQLVSPLDAKVGLGKITKTVMREADIQFRRYWSEDEISWRCNNPARKIAFHSNSNFFHFTTPVLNNILSAYAELSLNFKPLSNNQVEPSLLNLFIGLNPSATSQSTWYFSIPDFLRPSPLNMIFLSLDENTLRLDKTKILLSFLDFDAY